MFYYVNVEIISNRVKKKMLKDDIENCFHNDMTIYDEHSVEYTNLDILRVLNIDFRSKLMYGEYYSYSKNTFIFTNISLRDAFI